MLTNDKAVGVRPTPATAQTKTTKRHFTSRSTSTAAQIARLIELLRHGPRSTHELRRHGISHPAGRVQNLVQHGYLIASDRVTTVDSDGFSHVGVALYSLIAEPDATRASAGAGNDASGPAKQIGG